MISPSLLYQRVGSTFWINADANSHSIGNCNTWHLRLVERSYSDYVWEMLDDPRWEKWVLYPLAALLNDPKNARGHRLQIEIERLGWEDTNESLMFDLQYARNHNLLAVCHATSLDGWYIKFPGNAACWWKGDKMLMVTKSLEAKFQNAVPSCSFFVKNRVPFLFSTAKFDVTVAGRQALLAPRAQALHVDPCLNLSSVHLQVWIISL